MQGFARRPVFSLSTSRNAEGAAAMHRDRTSGSRTTVLIADDQPLFAEAVELVLAADERFEVVARAGDGVEALESAKALQPHVVLMDVHMPRMDGCEATREILRLRRRTAVIMLSSSGDPEDVARSLEAGAVGYLTKDADAARLVSAILDAAAARQAPPRVARAGSRLLRSILAGPIVPNVLLASAAVARSER
jgi:DNA-binding NarL/FixJ family response regulator